MAQMMKEKQAISQGIVTLKRRFFHSGFDDVFSFLTTVSGALVTSVTSLMNDITGGNLPDYMQHPLEPQTTSYYYYYICSGTRINSLFNV